MTPGVYVTGTDTGIGKTFAACALLGGLRVRGLRATGMKPVSSGCRHTLDGLRNEDAEALIAASSSPPRYVDCNPFALEEAIAPHLAARFARVQIELPLILAAHDRLARGCDRVVVEGVGGWMAPLADKLMQADLVRALDVPVILVVGLRLGCISHALLTQRAIAADGCRIAGWIANRIDPAMQRADENVQTLRERIGAPLLGVLAHDGAPLAAARRGDALDVRDL